MRPCPFVGDWKIAKSYDEAVLIMQENEIEEAWLDHDLAPEHNVEYLSEQEYTEKTGYDFVLWMQENNKWPSNICMVHSLNPIGSKRMCEVIAEYYKTLIPMKHYISYQRIEFIIKGVRDSTN